MDGLAGGQYIVIHTRSAIALSLPMHAVSSLILKKKKETRLVEAEEGVGDAGVEEEEIGEEGEDSMSLASLTSIIIGGA